MTVDLQGKWALVTGASRGIGRVVARRLGELGCNVVVHSRDLSHTGPLERESVLPGALVPVLIEDEVQGTLFRAQDHATHASRAGS